MSLSLPIELLDVALSVGAGVLAAMTLKRSTRIGSKLDRALPGRSQTSVKIKIGRPPGLPMTWLAAIVFSPKIKELLFDPIVSDYQHEYFEAIQDGAGRARIWCLCIRHWCGFAIGVLSRLLPLLDILKKIMKSS